MSDLIKNLQSIAKNYRLQSGRRGGVIVFYKNEVQDWVDELRDPESWAPGCVAIDETGNCWVAVGGDACSGADCWAEVETGLDTAVTEVDKSGTDKPELERLSVTDATSRIDPAATLSELNEDITSRFHQLSGLMVTLIGFGEHQASMEVSLNMMWLIDARLEEIKNLHNFYDIKARGNAE